MGTHWIRLAASDYLWLYFCFLWIFSSENISHVSDIELSFPQLAQAHLYLTTNTVIPFLFWTSTVTADHILNFTRKNYELLKYSWLLVRMVDIKYKLIYIGKSWQVASHFHSDKYCQYIYVFLPVFYSLFYVNRFLFSGQIDFLLCYSYLW